MLAPISDYRLRQREYLLRIAQAMTSRLDLSDLLRLVIEKAVEILDAEAGLIALREEGYPNLQVYARYGLDKDLLDLFAPLLAGEFLDRLLQTGSWASPDLRDPLRIASSVLGVRLRQVVALPLVVAGEPMGVIYIFRSSSRPVFSPNDQQVLSAFADQAAIAVHNARLYQRLLAEKRHLDTIIENSADGVMILDGQWKIQTANRSLEQMLGRHRSEIVGRTCAEVLQLVTPQGAPVCTGCCPLEALGPGPHPYVEGAHTTPDGRRIHLGITYSVLRTPDGSLREAIANVRDITRMKEAEEVKSTFVSIVSHELKTPVAIIKGYASTLRREDANWDPDTLTRGLQVIEEESDRLDNLISNLLEASRIQAGGLQLNLAPLEIVGMVRKLAEGFRPQTDQHTFEVEFPADFPPVWVDYERMRMVLSNLIANAIKYSPHGGTIRIGGWGEQDRVVIYVADQGIGIAEAEFEHIFERFYRVDNRASRTTAGTGLGLYLCKAVVEAHGGEIWVKSQVGQGSTFFFSLPRQEGEV